MSRRKKKLFARKYQPWYAKKAALAAEMEQALEGRPELQPPPPRMYNNNPLVVDSNSGSTISELVIDAAGGFPHIVDTAARLNRIEEGMRRWHKAVRTNVRVRGRGKR